MNALQIRKGQPRPCAVFHHGIEEVFSHFPRTRPGQVFRYWSWFHLSKERADKIAAQFMLEAFGPKGCQIVLAGIDKRIIPDNCAFPSQKQ